MVLYSIMVIVKQNICSNIERNILKYAYYFFANILIFKSHLNNIRSRLPRRILLLFIVSACSASDIGLPDFIAADDNEANLVLKIQAEVNLSFDQAAWIEVPNITVNKKDKLVIDIESNVQNLCPSIGLQVRPGIYASEDFTLEPNTNYTIMFEKSTIEEQVISCNNYAQPMRNGENLYIYSSPYLEDISSENSSKIGAIESPLNNPGDYFIINYTNTKAFKEKISLAIGQECTGATGKYKFITHIISDQCNDYYNGPRSTKVLDQTSRTVNYKLLSTEKSKLNSVDDDGIALLKVSNNLIQINDDGDLNLFLKVKQPALSSNNIGNNYKVKIRVYRSKQETPIGDFLNSLITPIKQSSFSASQQIYEGIVGNSNFKSAIRAALILYIVIYSIMFTIGMTRINHKDLLERSIKIALILVLISANSWKFFNEYCLQIFMSGMEELLYYLTGTEATNSAGIFGFVDKIFQDIFVMNNILKLTSLITNSYGIVAFACVLYFLFMYLFVILESFIGYLIAILSISLMVSLAPLFIVLLLFENTKKYFEGWFKYLVNFAIQPVILFTIINILNSLLIIAYKNMLNFSVEWQNAIPIYININYILQTFFIDFISLPIIPLFYIQYYTPNFSGGEAQIVTFKTVMVFGILVHIMKVVTELAPQMSNLLTSVTQGAGTEFTGKGSIASNTIGNTLDGARSVVGADAQSKQRRANTKEAMEVRGVLL